MSLYYFGLSTSQSTELALLSKTNECYCILIYILVLISKYYKYINVIIVPIDSVLISHEHWEYMGASGGIVIKKNPIILYNIVILLPLC